MGKCRIEVVHGIWNNHPDRDQLTQKILSTVREKIPQDELDDAIHWSLLTLSIEWDEAYRSKLKVCEIQSLPSALVFRDSEFLFSFSLPCNISQVLSADFDEDETCRLAIEAYNNLDLSLAAEL
jgi:hypothetical protein